MKRTLNIACFYKYIVLFDKKRILATDVFSICSKVASSQLTLSHG